MLLQVLKKSILKYFPFLHSIRVRLIFLSGLKNVYLIFPHFVSACYIKYLSWLQRYAYFFHENAERGSYFSSIATFQTNEELYIYQ